MCCLDIVRMIVSPGSAHSFGIPMIWHDVGIISELFVADRAYAGLLSNFPIEKLAHFCGGAQFPVTPRMVRVLDSLNSKSDQLRLG
jgi:hypothetical protein